MKREIILTADARDDITDLYDFIANRDGAQRAIAYVERFQAWLAELAHFPERGMNRNDLFPGLRLLAYRRQLTVAIQVQTERVFVLRVAYRGRDIDGLFK